MKKLMWLVFIAGVALAFNWQFLLTTSNAEIMGMNDVVPIMGGYHATPHLWTDGLAWWHGTWIQQGIISYRPLSAYVYWLDCWVGENYGWVWVGWIGYLLFVAALIPVAWLAWRWTGHVALTALAVVIGAAVRFFNPGQEAYWLVWFPIHQELLVIALFVPALCCFDWWLQSGSKRALALTWLAMIVGCFSKEYGYIFPVVAMAMALVHPHRVVTRKAAAVATALMLAFVLAFACYRSSVLTGARNPTLQATQFLRKPLIFCYPEAARDMLTGVAYLPCLSILWFVLAGCWLKARRHWLAQQHSGLVTRVKMALLNSFGGPLALLALVTILYFMAWGLPVVETLSVFLLGGVAQQRRADFALVFAECYFLWLGWKYRGSNVLLMAWLCWVLSYMPVLDYIGWHYTLGPLLLKGVYFAVLVPVVLHDTGALLFLKKIGINFSTKFELPHRAGV